MWTDPLIADSSVSVKNAAQLGTSLRSAASNSVRIIASAAIASSARPSLAYAHAWLADKMAAASRLLDACASMRPRSNSASARPGEL
ncbi:hypothetical protein [Kibdelosporangium aridum]|uniref:hypothetical protein n=1 Tax=Kibdelosporangium aridum TaxID=2030 RepID=UPI0035F0AD51